MILTFLAFKILDSLAVFRSVDQHVNVPTMDRMDSNKQGGGRGGMVSCTAIREAKIYRTTLNFDLGGTAICKIIADFEKTKINGKGKTCFACSSTGCFMRQPNQFCN
jgi:hypothetical protein